MTLLVFKSCCSIVRVHSSVRDVNMLDKIRDKRTDKVKQRVAARGGSGEANLILMLIEWLRWYDKG